MCWVFVVFCLCYCFDLVWFLLCLNCFLEVGWVLLGRKTVLYGQGHFSICLSINHLVAGS